MKTLKLLLACMALMFLAACGDDADFSGQAAIDSEVAQEVLDEMAAEEEAMLDELAAEGEAKAAQCKCKYDEMAMNGDDDDDCDDDDDDDKDDDDTLKTATYGDDDDNDDCDDDDDDDYSDDTTTT